MARIQKQHGFYTGGYLGKLPTTMTWSTDIQVLLPPWNAMENTCEWAGVHGMVDLETRLTRRQTTMHMEFVGPENDGPSHQGRTPNLKS